MNLEQITKQLQSDIPNIEQDSLEFYQELITRVNNIEPIVSFNLASQNKQADQMTAYFNFGNDINTPTNNIIAQVETDLEEYYEEDIDYIQLGEGNQQILIYFAY